MGYFKTSLKVLSQIIAILVLASFSLTESFAKAGCCSHHGGMAGCNTSGQQLCKDGTVSPSCPCKGSNNTVKPVKTTKTKTSTQTTQTPATTSTPATATTTTTAATTTTVAPKGCCSRHGGVGQCNKTKGFFMCKDGTQSASCKCS